MNRNKDAKNKVISLKKFMSKSDGFLLVCLKKNLSMIVFIGNNRLIREAYMTHRRYVAEFCIDSYLWKFSSSIYFAENAYSEVSKLKTELHMVIAS